LDALAERVRAGIPADVARTEVVDVDGFLGSGAAPARGLASRAVAVDVDGRRAAPLAEALRRGAPRVYARIEGDRVLLDVRTVLEEEIDALADAVVRAARTSRGAA